MKRWLMILGASLMVTNGFSAQNCGDDMNCHLLNAMQAYHVPVAGYAIIDGYKVVQANTLSLDNTITVNQSSLFQAASISKVLPTIGALKLVEKGTLKLDAPANAYLSSWQIPTNHFNAKHPVLVKQLLDMTSGLSISNFDGYPQGQPLPTLLNLLNGKAPANNVPVEVLYQPGSKYSYSNGGFETLQQITEDLTKQSFANYQNNEIIKSLRMNDSVFEFPLSKKHAAHAVPGYVGDAQITPGGWNNYAGLAACGMWSTPTDVAKLALAVTDAYLGKNNGIISQSLAKQMLTRQINTPFGFGVVVSGHGQNMNFAKTGHTKGYQSLFVMFPNLGKGVVIMTNAESGDKVIDYFVSAVAKANHWPYYFPFFDESIYLPDY